MALENIKKVYNGGTVATTLASSINDVATSIVLTAGATYPTGSDGPFVIAIDRGLSTEEKILCSARTVNTLTVQQRGYDGSTAQAHTSPAAIILVADAHAIQQANWIVNGYSEAGTKGTTGHPLVGTSGLPAWQQLGTAGIADSAVTAAKIADATITAAKMAADFTVERVGGVWTAGETVPNGGAYISWDVEAADTDGFGVAGSDTITIPAGFGGVYAIHAIVYGLDGGYQFSNSQVGMSIEVGGFTILTPLTTGTTSQLSIIRPISAGGTIKVLITNTTGSSRTVSAQLYVYRLTA